MEDSVQDGYLLSKLVKNTFISSDLLIATNPSIVITTLC